MNNTAAVTAPRDLCLLSPHSTAPTVVSTKCCWRGSRQGLHFGVYLHACTACQHSSDACVVAGQHRGCFIHSQLTLPLLVPASSFASLLLHAAGTIAGTNTGVAKAARIIAVRVLDASGSGSSTGVANGINWVANSPLPNKVISMSLGGGYSSAINNAVAAASAAGVLSVVAAGNDNANACNYSPGRRVPFGLCLVPLIRCLFTSRLPAQRSHMYCFRLRVFVLLLLQPPPPAPSLLVPQTPMMSRHPSATMAAAWTSGLQVRELLVAVIRWG